MPPPVENIAAHRQPQDLQHGDMGYYDMADDHPPLHEYHGQATNNYARAALDAPAQAQAQAAPPAPVCTGLIFRIQISNQTFRRGRLTYLTTQLSTPRLALLRATSMNCLSPMGLPMKSFGSLQSSTCSSLIHKLPCSAWNLAMSMESGWSLPSNWLAFEVATGASLSSNNESF
jgi:hypothetical protein